MAIGRIVALSEDDFKWLNPRTKYLRERMPESEWKERLKEPGYAHRIVERGITGYFTVEGPNGNVVELYAHPRFAEQFPWGGRDRINRNP